MWTNDEIIKSSTWRELKAVEITLKGCVDFFKNKFVKLFTDNQNVERISEVGSMKKDLQSLAIDIFHFCVQNCICLKVQWIPRELNTIADQYSRIFDFDDWSVADRIFHYFNKIWGPFTIDRFANSNNKKLHRFNSRFLDPLSSGIDAFTYDWSVDNNWLVPPVSLIAHTIKHIQLCKAELVVPKWKFAIFWPMLVCPESENFISIVKDYIEYETPSRFFVRGSADNSVFSENKFISNVLVLHLDARY